MDFIFMLTRNDRTVPDAEDHLAVAQSLGVAHLGFKDIGLPFDRLRGLADAIRAQGATSYLEVVSEDRDSELASARAAREIGVDVLLGGTHARDVLPILAGSGIRYYPFPGRVTGHPSVLNGPVGDIVASARNLAALDGVHGLDLLAWRYAGDVPPMIAQVCAVAGKPVIVAGSIDSADRIGAAWGAGAAGFTIGTAALDGAFVGAGPTLSEQLGTILAVTARASGRINPNHPVDMGTGFAAARRNAAPEVAALVGGSQVRLARVDGSFAWRRPPRGDELVMVSDGRLALHFRDRTEVLGPGQFLVIPEGIEHRPEALEGPCHVLLVEPATAPGTAASPTGPVPNLGSLWARE